MKGTLNSRNSLNVENYYPKKMKTKILTILIALFSIYPSIALGQFWEGFLYGLGRAAQNYNYQNQYNNNNNSSKSRSVISGKTKEIEEDGFVWYRLSSADSKSGIANEDGDIILYPKYGFIYYSVLNKHFRVESDGGKYVGALSKGGKWIIPLSRKYEHITMLDEYFSVKRNGYEGACNLNGVEIIAPEYSNVVYSSGEFHYQDINGDWIGLNIDINGNKIRSNNPNHSNNHTARSIGTPFRLQSGKYYKVEQCVFEELTLPFEAEISLIELGANKIIIFNIGDGNGNVDSVKMFDAEISGEDDNATYYNLTARAGQDGVTGVLKLTLLSSDGNVMVGIKTTDSNNSSNTNIYIMNPVPHNTPILVRQ